MSGRRPGPESLDVVYFCCWEKWWDWERSGFVSRTACIARELARDPRVRRLIVVNEPTNLLKSWSLPDGDDGVPVRLHGVTRSGARGPYVVDDPRLLPRERMHRLPFLINARLHDVRSARRIRSLLDALDVTDPVIWLAGPLVAKCAAAFHSATLVYDAADEWLGLETLRPMRREVRLGYKTIRETADIVFAASEALAHSFSGGHPVVQVAPNGVDPERFAGCEGEPADLIEIPHPRVGYAGFIQERLDVGLVRAIAAAMPGVSFVFVGPVLNRRHVAPLASVRNVHFIGERPFSSIPAYLRQFDACMLPHVDSLLTRNMDPLKLYEYVAAGRPTVATDLPGIRQPNEFVRRARDAREFVESLEGAISGRWRVDEARRSTYVAEVAWPNRVGEMLTLVLEHRSGLRGCENADAMVPALTGG